MIAALLQRVRARIAQTPDLARLQERGLRLGRDVYIGRGALIDPWHCWLIDIADEVTISEGAAVLAHDASMRRLVGFTRVARTRIGARAYLGARAVILPGVNVGDGSIVGAGAVVTRDVPPGSVVAGNPARVIGSAHELGERHRRALAEHRVYRGLEWTMLGGITGQRRETMRRELIDGDGYVP